MNQGFAYGAVTLFGGTFQSLSLPLINPMSGPHNPETTVVASVWASPRSLAATDGISIDFFS